jgi:DNA-directed RNA polymerase specialized sigma24 family protein
MQKWLLLEELDEPDRELVKLKYFNELKYREISSQKRA